MTVAGLAVAGAAVVASVILGDRTRGAPGPQPADSMLVQAAHAQADTLPAPDSTPAAAPARESVTHPDDRRTRPDDRPRQPVVATQPVDAGQQTVETLESALDTTPVRRLPGPPDTRVLLTDTARSRTVPPAYPR